MLTQLRIDNFAIIEHIQIDFQNNMSVLTGETGAGKSIIIDAIAILNGERTSNEIIRFGADYAYIEGVFLVGEHHPASELLRENGIEYDEFLIVSRRIGQNGKSICRANGKAITVNTLRAIGALLIDIHSQHETQYLLQPKNHLRLLDQFVEFDELYQMYKVAFQAYTDIKKKFTVEQQRIVTAEQLDLYQYQLTELQGAQIQPGELEQLEQEHREFANANSICDILTYMSNQLLNDEQAVIPMLHHVKKQFEQLQRYSTQYDGYVEQFTNLYYELSELSTAVSQEYQQFDNQTARLQEIEARMSLIYQLQRKYGQDLSAYEQFLLAEIERIENYDAYIGKLGKQLEVAQQEAGQLANKMSVLRKEQAATLTLAIEQQLTDLQMPYARINILIEKQELQATGQDRVEFLLMANKGELFRPLAKIASGGELSRIMLGMKVIFAKKQPIQTMIFDEVDTGVSGAVAQAIAQKMAELAKDMQILCITHLPQVAAMSQHHLFVSKHVTHTHVKTEVETLNVEERIEALAQMLAGEHMTQTARQHAKELLAMTH